MTTFNEVVSYLYAQTAASIHQLKTEAFKSTTDEKYAYQAPDGKTFRNKRPNQALIDAGWKFTKVKFQRIESCMSPRHPRWQDYRNAKRDRGGEKTAIAVDPNANPYLFRNLRLL